MFIEIRPFNSSEEDLKSRTGILSYPFIVFGTFCAWVITVNPGDAILTIPPIKTPANGATIFNGMSVNVTQTFKQYGDIYDYYMLATDIAMISAVILLAYRKIMQMLNN